MASKKDLFKKSNDMLSKKVKKIEESTKNALKEVDNNPSKENYKKAVDNIKSDIYLLNDEKNKLIEQIQRNYIELFNFNACPDDYNTLKQEAKFLSEMTQYSFFLMAQRLKKIRDERMYEIDGYNDFKEFLNNEITMSRRTAYNYIDIYEFFGVQTIALDSPLEYSKLLPVLPLLKSDKNNIPKTKIKTQFLKDINKKSANEIKQEARELKIKYGLIVEKEPQSIYEKMESMIVKITDSPNTKDKIIIRNIIKKLKSYLSEDHKTKKSKDDDTNQPDIFTI